MIWSSNAHHTIIFHSNFDYKQFYYDHLSVILRSSKDHRMIILLSSFICILIIKQYFYGQLSVIIWSSKGHLSVIIWSSKEHLMTILWSTQCHHTIFFQLPFEHIINLHSSCDYKLVYNLNTDLLCLVEWIPRTII